MDKMLLFGVLLVCLGIVFGQDCNQLNNCMMQFTSSFGELQEKISDSEGIKSFCGDLDKVMSDTKDCQKEVVGDDPQACQQMITTQNFQLDAMAGSFKKMICEPDDECGYINVFKCYGDMLKGLGVDSIETTEDMAKIMKLGELDMKDVDQEKFCKYTVPADQEAIEKCVEEKSKGLMACMIGPMSPGAGGEQGGPGGPGGPGEAGPEGEAPPEGANFPEGFDPSSIGMPEGYPEGQPEGQPEGADAEGGPGGMPSFSMNTDMFKNASVICKPGCGNFFKTQGTLENFKVEDEMIEKANSAENGTDEFTEACGALDAKLGEAEKAAGGCEVQQGIVTGMVKSNMQLEEAIGKCEIALEFKDEESAAVSVVLSFHALLLAAVLLVF